MPLFIGGETFASKAAVKRRCREIIAGHANGEAISGGAGLFLRDLIQRHPEAEEKVGAGIKCFTVATDSRWAKTRHFVVRRVDGTSTDFSFISCVDGASVRADVLQALRAAVAGQVLRFKNTNLEGASCPFTGEALTRDCHVDHAAPNTFLRLAEDWLKRETLDYDGVRITSGRDNQVCAQMEDANQERSWYEFHRERACLRLVSKKGNLSYAKRRSDCD